MKIVHLCLSCFYIDGYSYQENILPKYHVRLGHSVTVIASLFSFDKDGKGCYLPNPSTRKDEGGYRVIRIANKKPSRINRFLRRYQGLEKILEYEKPDLIFSHGLSMVEVNTLVGYLKKHPRVRFYADHHGDYFNSARNLLSKYLLHAIVWRHYVKKLEPYARRIYGVTPLRCKFLREMYSVDPRLVEYLPLGVDDDAIPEDREKVNSLVRKALGVGSDDLLIFTGGKIDLMKNTHVLLDAVRRLNDPRVHLVICGVLAPEMDYLREVFDSRIHYLGWCDAARVMDCMVASDIACFPGTHSTLWEQSLGLGLPAILKKWKDMLDVSVEKYCLMIKGDDAEEIKDCISKFFNPAFKNEMRIRAESGSRRFLYSNIARTAIEL